MPRRMYWCVTLGLALACFSGIGRSQMTIEMPSAKPSNDYPLTADSMAHPDVPKGTVFKFSIKDSKIFPNTSQEISVYVPAEYDPSKPACVWVGLDSLGFGLPTVFDNLIAQHAMPVTIGVGVSSATAESADSPKNPRFERSLEFDSMDDRLARFLLEEVLPAVEAHKTPDGKAIVLSKSANDRGIGGSSTGGIGSFNVAWHRPDEFRRVFISIGTFVGMHGGEQFYVQVRKTEPKPIRVYMQDGLNDEWGGGPGMGDWWMSNVTMQRALDFAGYDVQHTWGLGTHDGHQAAQLFPAAMRFLWKDWPAAVPAGKPGNARLKEILKPGEGWQVATETCAPVLHLSADPRGKLFISGHAAGQKDAQVPAGTKCTALEANAPTGFGPDGQAYRINAERGGSVLASGGASPIARNLAVHDLVVRANGDVYVTAEAAASDPAAGRGEIWLIRPNQEKIRVASGLKGASGLAFSPDGLWLMALQHDSRWSYSYRVQKDGTLDAGERFYDVYVPSSADDSGASAVAMDKDGRAYVATRMGVQVFDHNGRVIGILPLPGDVPAAGLTFGGSDFATLYVSSGGKVYQRPLLVPGFPSWLAPKPVPNWGGG